MMIIYDAMIQGWGAGPAPIVYMPGMIIVTGPAPVVSIFFY